jgi:hypothetical protein
MPTWFKYRKYKLSYFKTIVLVITHVNIKIFNNTFAILFFKSIVSVTIRKWIHIDRTKLYCMYSLFLLLFIRHLDFVGFCNLQINPSFPSPQKQNNYVGQLGKTLKLINLHTTFQTHKLQKKVFSHTTFHGSHDSHRILHLWLLLLGNSWTPKSSWCKTHNWVIKPSFGQIQRFSLTVLIASLKVILRFNIRKAMMIVADLLTPDTQWINSLPTKYKMHQCNYKLWKTMT